MATIGGDKAEMRARLKRIEAGVDADYAFVCTSIELIFTSSIFFQSSLGTAPQLQPTCETFLMYVTRRAGAGYLLALFLTSAYESSISHSIGGTPSQSQKLCTAPK
jgi:hypothetical protein